MRKPHRPLPTLLSAVIAATLLGTTTLFTQALAQTPPTASNSLIAFDIPAGNLDQALNQIALIAKVEIIADASLTQGKRTNGFKGAYTLDAALNLLLQENGLAHSHNNSVITLERAKPLGKLATVKVIASGEKLNRSENETLSSVDITTAEEIVAHGDTNLQNIMERTPGVYSQSANENWGIRGVPASGFDDQGPAAMNGAVSVYVDDAVQAHRMITFNPLHLWDMEQVEIYSGAQSTTQGRNTLAGAVVLRTKKPTFTPEFALRTNAGTYGERGVSAMASGALIDGVLAARIAIDSQHYDGYITNKTLNIDANPLEAQNIRGKLLFTPTEKINVLFTAARTKHSTGTNAVAATAGKPDYFHLYENTESDTNITQDALTLKVDYTLDDHWTFTSITSSTQVDFTSLLDFDQLPSATQTIARNHEQELANQEFRLGYNTEKITGFIGAYYGRVDGKVDDQLMAGSVVALDLKADTTINNAALFGEINWEFIDNWQLIGGLRYDREKNETDIRYPLNPARSAQSEKDTDVFLPKIGISHNLSENQLIGLTWRRGYRSGGVNLRTNTSHVPYDPEFTKTTELSWRGNWFNEQLQARANLYHTDWIDQQITFLDDNNNRQVANAAESKMQGIEFSASYALSPNLSLSAGGAYNHTEYLEFITNGANYSGQAFLFAPKTMATLGANYRFDNGWMIGVDLVHQGDRTSAYLTDSSGEVIGERRSDNTTLVNLNAEITLFDSLIVNGYVRNLFDTRYITNNQGDTLLDVGAPLTLGVALSYYF